MHKLKFLTFLIIGLILLAGCAPLIQAPAAVVTSAPAATAPRTRDTAAAPSQRETSVTPTLQTTAASATPAPDLTALTPTRPAELPTLAAVQPANNRPLPTSPARLPAERWQEWPVVPAVTRTFVETYRKGLALGNDPHAFSKVGDCQSVTVAFLGIYDQPGAYSLPKGEERLQATIDWFKGAWGRDSQAVRGGFNVASVLSSFLADPRACQPGQTPLDCEFGQNKPSIVLISMETGFEGRTAAVYEKYMRKIIEYALARGAAPVLATKADNFEGDHSINLTTARLAVEYDLPLWNFWRAVQPLPDHGMDAQRNDKFHISVEAWNERSFTALQVLDALRSAQ